MRFHAASGLAVAGAMIVALTATACSSSSTSSTSTPTATSATTPVTTTTPVPTASGSASATVSGNATSSGAAAQITTNWEAFFNSSTPNATRASLLENGSTFSSAISGFSSNPLAAGITAKVLSVALTSTTQATVKYDIVSGSTVLLPNETGTAVLADGGWKVGDASFCQLLGLVPGGTVPSACKS